jgi:O-antigen polymerase
LLVGVYYSDKFVDRFIVPKQMLFFFLTGYYLLIAGLKLVFQKRQFSLKLSLVDIAILFYVAYIITHIVLTDSHKFRVHDFLLLVSGVTVYFAMRIILGDIKETDTYLKAFKYLLTILFLLTIVEGVRSLFQYFGITDSPNENFRIVGSFGNPGPLANFMVISLPLSLGSIVLFQRQTRFDRLLFYISVVVLVITLIVLTLTQARTSWLAAILAVILVVNYKYNIWKKAISILNTGFKKIAFSVIILGLALLLGKVLFSFKEGSSSGRLFIWEVTLNMVKDDPLLGKGVSTYPVEHNVYQAAYFQKSGLENDYTWLADNVTYAFNEYFEIAAETGMLGLLLFLFILFAALFKYKAGANSHDGNRGIQTLTSITLITILFSGLFSYPLHSSPVLLLFFVLLGIKSSSKIPYRSFNLSKNTIRIFGLLLTAVAIWFLTFQYSRQSALKVWKEAAVFAQNGKYRPAFEKYESIYPILSYNPHFLYNYGSELSLAKQYKKSISVLHQAEKQLNDADLYTYLANSYEGIGNIEKAEYYYKYINWLIPHRIYPKYRLVYLYAKNKQMDKALVLASEIVNQKVKIESNTTEQIKGEMKQFIHNYSTQ